MLAFTSMLRRLTVPLAILLTVVALVGACGYDSDGNEVGGVQAGDEATSTHPPSSIDDLAAEFDDLLEPLGLHITRGDVIDRSEGGYVPSPTGDHLALYVEPLDDAAYSPEDYVDGLGTVTALVTPLVFERWSGIQSYDICQEPPADVDDRTAPAPYTQIEIDRVEAEAVDWDTATAATVIELGLVGKARVVVTAALRETQAYKDAAGIS